MFTLDAAKDTIAKTNITLLFMYSKYFAQMIVVAYVHDWILK